MLIHNMDIDINYLDELEPYMDKLGRQKVTEDRLISCSPFRPEMRPSFAVNLQNGTYIDSGSTDDDWKKGNFIKLLSFFREETYQDTEHYLLDKYHIVLSDANLLTLNFTLTLTKINKEIDENLLISYMYRHPYLTNRGISEQVQRGFKIGYDQKTNSILFPVYSKDNRLINIKYRRIDNKIFWYHKDGDPIKQHLYGLNHIYRKQSKVAYIVEGEVDCMYLWSYGYPSIATFGASLTEKQKQLILSSPIETLVIAVDNDRVGRDYRDKLVQQFGGLLEIKEIILPESKKDVNELDPIMLKAICDNPVIIGIKTI